MGEARRLLMVDDSATMRRMIAAFLAEEGYSVETAVDGRDGLRRARELSPELILTDYTFAKDKIFAYLTLEDSELMIYNRLYEMLRENVPRPDLVIYLQASLDTLLKRVKKRGKAYEKSLSQEYLKEISEAYSHYFYRYDETPLLVVNTNEIDFVNTPEHFDQLIEQIRNAKKGTQYYVPLGS